jgi:hypothetical protein
MHKKEKPLLLMAVLLFFVKLFITRTNFNYPFDLTNRYQKETLLN